MKLLFDTQTTAGSTELKELLGFIDADLKLKNLIPDINTATNDIVDIIGLELYTAIYDIYKTTAAASLTDFQKQLIYATRYPIAVNAYMLHAPSNDIAHTNNGRKMRQDENEKQAFEWMLDRDDRSLEKRYYRAIDDLIVFLDGMTDSALKNIWVSSDAYKSINKTFIKSTVQFDIFFPIKSRLLLIKLAPAIALCEQYEIKPRIGTEKFSTLKTAFTANTVTDAQDLELIRLIQQASAYYSLAWAMPRLSVNLFPQGVLQHVSSGYASTSGTLPAVKSEVEAARQAFQADTEQSLKAIEKLLQAPPAVNETLPLLPDQMFGDGFFSA